MVLSRVYHEEIKQSLQKNKIFSSRVKRMKVFLQRRSYEEWLKFFYFYPSYIHMLIFIFYSLFPAMIVLSIIHALEIPQQWSIVTVPSIQLVTFLIVLFLRKRTEVGLPEKYFPFFCATIRCIGLRGPHGIPLPRNIDKLPGGNTREDVQKQAGLPDPRTHPVLLLTILILGTTLAISPILFSSLYRYMTRTIVGEGAHIDL